jgi:hypothetical protein
MDEFKAILTSNYPPKVSDVQPLRQLRDACMQLSTKIKLKQETLTRLSMETKSTYVQRAIHSLHQRRRG